MRRNEAAHADIVDEQLKMLTHSVKQLESTKVVEDRYIGQIKALEEVKESVNNEIEGLKDTILEATLERDDALRDLKIINHSKNGIVKERAVM